MTGLLVSIKFKFFQNTFERNQSRGFLGNYVSRHLIYVIKQWKETFDSKKIAARDLDCRTAKILKAKTQIDKYSFWVLAQRVDGALSKC